MRMKKKKAFASIKNGSGSCLKYAMSNMCVGSVMLKRSRICENRPELLDRKSGMPHETEIYECMCKRKMQERDA